MPPTPQAPPACPIYVDAWFLSVSVSTMPAACESAYMRLLLRQWLAVTLPADPEDLRTLTKATEKEWVIWWPKYLADQFPVEESHIEGKPPGRRNPTQYAIWKERQDFLEKQSRNGAKGGRPNKQDESQTETQGQTDHETQPETQTEAKKTSGIGSGSELQKQKTGAVQRSQPQARDRTDSVNGSGRDASEAKPKGAENGTGRIKLVRSPEANADIRAKFDELADAARGKPHEVEALKLLLATRKHPEMLLLELHALGKGSPPIRGRNTRKPADMGDVMRTVTEFVVNEMTWSSAFFQGCLRRTADRPPEPMTRDEIEQLRREAGTSAKPSPDAEQMDMSPDAVAERKAKIEQIGQQWREAMGRPAVRPVAVGAPGTEVGQ